MSQNMILDAQMIALFPWVVGALFYAFGLVCAYNLYVEWYNWRLEVQERKYRSAYGQLPADAIHSIPKQRVYWHGQDIDTLARRVGQK